MKKVVFGVLLAGVAGLNACNSGTSSMQQPNPSEQVVPTDNTSAAPSFIRINQYAYAPLAPKRATLVVQGDAPVDWVLRDASGTEAAKGRSLAIGEDLASGEYVHRVDFSSLQQAGKFTLEVDGASPRTVNVVPDPYSPLLIDALRFFHFHRMGEAILEQHVRDPRHAREAIHPADNALPCLNDWCGGDVTLNVKNSWYDAGDFGAYAVNMAISSWTLLNAYEFAALDYGTQDLAIPESGNGIPDILDEVQFGSTFMAGMLPPGQLLASHKIHNVQWSGFDGVIAQENQMPRHAQPPSTAATLAVARNAAHLARVFMPFDETYALSQWQVAMEAWQRAESQPVKLYTSETEDSIGGGNYDDTNIADDRYAAAVELWITATKRQAPEAEAFARRVRSLPEFLTFDADGAQQWQQVQGSGSLSLWIHQTVLGLTQQEISTLQTAIMRTADLALSSLESSGYPMVYNPSLSPSDTRWPWGSNSFVLNRLIVLAYAHSISQAPEYLAALHAGMDYLLGNNPMDLSYITGYGESYTQDLHDRVAYPLLRDAGVPFPPGWVAGGPLTGWPGCDKATPETGAPAKRYAPPGTATDAWCSKEVAINWNSPLVWVTAYLSANTLN